MKRIGFIICAALLVFTTFSCKSLFSCEHKGKDITKVMRVNYFDRLTVKGACNVYFTQSAAPFMKIVGDSADVSRINVSNKGDELIIDSDNKQWLSMFDTGTNITIYLGSPDLIGLSMYGTGNFTATSKIDSDTLDVALSGSGDMHLLNVMCDKMSTTLRGVGNVNIAMLSCVLSNVELIGTGNININQHDVENTDVNLKGTGNVDVNFVNCINATCNLMGTGDISLSGTLRNLEQSVKGTGNINTGSLNKGKKAQM